MGVSGFAIVYRLTQAQIDAGEADALSGGFVEIVNASAQPTGVIMETGPAGATPTLVGAAATASGTAPVSLAGVGAVALTAALHAGKNLHAEPGQTSVTLTAADWPNGGELTLINHTGAALPVTLVGVWSGGYVNEAEGNSLTTGILTTLPALARAIVQVKDGAFVNVAVLGTAVPSYEDWSAATRVKKFEVRRATVALGEVKIGDLIRANSTRTTRASFDATEAAAWTEVSADPVQSVAGKTGVVTLAKADVGLGNVDNTTDAGKPVSTAQQTALDGKAASTHTHVQADVTGLAASLTAKQDALVSGTNIKTVNGSSLLGAGNVTADLPGGTLQTVTNEGLNSTGGTVTTDGADTVVTYTNTGTFKAPLGVDNVRVLAIAGGGGGGGTDAGGGGAGEYREIASLAVGTTAHAIAVGVGGTGGAGYSNNAGNSSKRGLQGGDTAIGALLTLNGGGGGGTHEQDGPTAGMAGGSGGGASGIGAGTKAGGASVLEGAGIGFAGGSSTSSGITVGCGGGGAGGVGAGTTNALVGGAGGAGIQSDITGTLIGYAGGGGGASRDGTTGAGNNGAGDFGGGRGGSDSLAPIAYVSHTAGVTSGAAMSGRANSGGGGGGGAYSVVLPIGTKNGADGGSGVVIVRFPTQSREYTALITYADNAAAVAGGLLVGQFFRVTASGAVAQVA